MDESRSDEVREYSASDIRVLEGREAIRKRPGMYVGSTDHRGLGCLLDEVVDLALEGAAPKLVEVRLHRDGSATVRDEGPGFAIEGSPSLERTMNRMHCGGHGLYLGVLNALSASVRVDVRRDGFLWRQSFGRGLATSPLERLGPTRGTGTAFTFRPDPEIFAEAAFDADPIAGRLADLAALHPEARFEFHDERTGRSEAWERRAGLVDLVLNLNRGRAALHPPIAFKGRCGKSEVSFAFQYHEGAGTEIGAFANLNRLWNHEKSTHTAGFFRALGKSLIDPMRPWQGRRGIPTGHLLEGLTAAVAIRLESPMLGGAQWERLDNPEARPIVYSIAFLRLFAHFEEHPDVAKRIRDRVARDAVIG